MLLSYKPSGLIQSIPRREGPACFDRGRCYRNLHSNKLSGGIPNLADARYHRGMAYRDMGRMDRALRDFDAVLGLDPDNASALRGAGASPWAAWAATTRRSGTSTGPWSSTQATPRPSRPGGWPTAAWSGTSWR